MNAITTGSEGDHQVRAWLNPGFESPMWAKPLRGLRPPDTVCSMSKRFVVSNQQRGRLSLGSLATAEQYIAHSEPGGIIVLEPATVITETEKKLLQDTALMAAIEQSRQHPETMTRRDRSRSPRD